MKLYELMQKLDAMQQVIIKDRNEQDNIYSGFLMDASGSWIFQTYDMEVASVWTKGPYLVIEVVNDGRGFKEIPGRSKE